MPCLFGECTMVSDTHVSQTSALWSTQPSARCCSMISVNALSKRTHKHLFIGHKMSPLHHSEETFEASFVQQGIALAQSRQPSAMEKARLNWGMRQVLSLQNPKRKPTPGSGWSTVDRVMVKMHTRDLLVGMHCCKQRLHPRHPKLGKKD
jgi:hypothetical protein